MDRNQRLIHIQNKKKKNREIVEIDSCNILISVFGIEIRKICGCCKTPNEKEFRIYLHFCGPMIKGNMFLTADMSIFFSCIFNLRKIVQSHRIQILCSGACHNATFQYIRLECSDAKTKRQKERGRKKRQCGTEREENRTERKKRQN